MTATLSRPPGLARAEQQAAEDAAWQKSVAEREALQAAQTLKSARIKLERLARKDPNVRALLEEHTALKAAADGLRSQLAILTEKHDSLSAECSRLAEDKISALQRAETAEAAVATLETARSALGRELDATRSDVAKARAELTRLKDAKDAKK